MKKAKLIHYLLSCVLLTLLCLWGIWVPGVLLATGDLASEVRMGHGIRAALNQILLSGEFPWWNPALSAGSVGQIFGTAPFNWLTPIELILGPNLPTWLLKLEVGLVYLLTALPLFLAFYKLRVPLAGGFIAALMAFSVDPMWVSLHVPWWMGATIVTYVSLQISLLLYIGASGTQEKKQALLCGLLSAALPALGVKTEMVYMFAIFASAQLLIFYLTQIFKNLASWNGRLSRDLIFAFFIFAIAPILAFAWQLPVMLSLISGTGTRISAGGSSLLQALEYLVFAFWHSRAFSCALLICGINAIAIYLVRFRRKNYLNYAIPIVLLILGFHFLLVPITDYSPNTKFRNLEHVWLSIGFLIAWAIWYAGIIKKGCDENRSIKSECFEVARWGFYAAGLWSLFLEGQALTIINPMPGILWAALGLFTTLGMFYNAHSLNFHKNKLSSEVFYSPQFRSALLNLLVTGWLLRDIAPLPIYSATGLLYVIPRDFWWVFVATAFLFAGGLNITFMKFFVLGKKPFYQFSFRTVRLSGLLVRTSVLIVCLLIIGTAGLRFYLTEGATSPNLVWKRYSADEQKILMGKRNMHLRTGLNAAEKNGGFARTLTPDNYEFGLSGVHTEYGLHEAWGYGYLDRNYRLLAEKAFRIKDYEDNPAPKALFYSSNAQRILGDTFLPRFFTSEIDYVEAYIKQRNDNHLGISSTIDPFYLELLRVGVIWDISIFRTETMQPHPQLTPVGGNVPAYLFRPSRSLARVGFIKDTEAGGGSLFSEVTDSTLKKLYQQIAFTSAEQSEIGVTLLEQKWRSSKVIFKVSSQNPVWLIIFDSWHKDWKAEVNSVPSDVRRAFINFRAIQIKEGESELVLTFMPKFQIEAVGITLATIFMMLIIAWRWSFFSAWIFRRSV